MFRKTQLNTPVVNEEQKSRLGARILFWIMVIIFISAIISQFVG
jgi:hypothetical protein